MSTLYRSPNVIIDDHEWHAIVRLHKGRISRMYRFRPVSHRVYAWAPITAWVGRKPKGLGRFFEPYRRHIALAMGSETRRRETAFAKGVPFNHGGPIRVVRGVLAA